MSCGFAHFDGSYVLGALSAADRRDFEDHLETCEDCSHRVRDLAGLPGLLARAGVGVWEDASLDEPVPVPDTLLPSLLDTMRRRRRGQLLSAVAGVAAAVVVGATLVATGVIGAPGGVGHHSSTAARDVVRPMSPIGQDTLRATVTLSAVAWGTRLDLTCTYAAYVQRGVGTVPTYVLVVHTRDGRTERLATWRAVAGRTITVSAGTALGTGEIASVEVLNRSQVPVLRSILTS